MTKERRLGRGLEALLGRAPEPVSQPIRVPGPASFTAPPNESAPEAAALSGQAVDAAAVDDQARRAAPPAADPPRLPVAQIDRNPYQPRTEFDEAELASLAESLVAHGLLQPILVRRIGARYQLVAGERRLRAAQRAGWPDVPVQVIEADDRQAAELAIVENVQRKDLGPLEKAASFQQYLRQYGCTQEELASRLKLDRSTIANLIRLLELPEFVQEALRAGRITQGHARALLPLGEEREQNAFCERIQEESLSVRQTEALVQETIDAADAEPLSIVDRRGRSSRRPEPQNEHLAALEQEFRAALGVKVRLTQSSRGRGKLVVSFRNHAEFELVRRHICDLPTSRQREAG